MKSSNKIQRAFHSCWQRTTVHLRNEIWVLINALYGKRMNWYVHWYVLQKAHSVNKVATVSGPFCCLPGADLPSMAASGPWHTILHWTLEDPPIPPSTQNNSNHQQNSNSSLSPSPTPPGLWQWEIWIAEHKPQPLLSSVYIGHVQHPTDQQLWIDPSHPTKPFNLWTSTGNPSLWMKQINSRLTKIYKITWASGSYPSATLLAACRLPQELKLTSRNTMVRHEKYSNA